MREHEGRAGPDRRAFLKELAAVALGGAAAAYARPAAALAGAAPLDAPLDAPRAAMPPLDRLGVQLYTVRDQMAADFEGTITRVAQIGYRNLEFAGYNGRTPAQVRALVDRLGVRAPSTHISLEQLRTALPAQIEAAQTIGHRYITVPSLGRTEAPLTTADAWKRVAEEMNRIGAQVKAAGLALAFHNHSGEFLDVGGGRRGMDVFISETDPSLVSFELDLMWARVAGQDPVAWFQRYPGRFKLWHVKDMRNLAAAQARQAAAFARPAAPPAAPPAPGAAPAQAAAAQRRAGEMAPVGSGEIAWAPIFAQAERSGLEYYFVEHDTAAQWPGGSLASLEASYRYIQRLVA